MAVAIRPDDMRRGKWTSFRGQSQDDLFERLQKEAETRTPSLFQEEEMVYTPKGIRVITSKYHTPTGGWHYRFWTRDYMYTYKEADIRSRSEGLLLILADLITIVA